MSAEISIGIVSALTLGLVQVVKQIGLPSKFAPLASLMFGVALSFVAIPGNWTTALISGLIAGLTAVGLWSGTKNTIAQ